MTTLSDDSSVAFTTEGRALYTVTKRLVDLAISLCALVVLSPVFLLIAVAIKLDSAGPVFFRQVRIGQHGAKFTCYKFRSMVQNADQKVYEDFIKQAMRANSNAPKGSGCPFRLKQNQIDSRITRVGAFLRRTSLDELPQLVNVLKGDMSLVGPRPDVPASVEEYSAFEGRRLQVLPGITGLWQVSGRANLTVRDMFELDSEYVEKCSLGVDLQILMKTIPAIIKMDGAR